MDRWVGKTAVVTGASSGIGASICVELANAGVNVIGLARRTQPVQDLKAKVTGNGSITARKCDVSSAEEVAATFKWIDESFGCVHILINNAGVLVQGGITVSRATTCRCGPSSTSTRAPSSPSRASRAACSTSSPIIRIRSKLPACPLDWWTQAWTWRQMSLMSALQRCVLRTSPTQFSTYSLRLQLSI